MLRFFNNIKRHVALNRMADFFEKVEPNEVCRTPTEVGLDFEEVSFRSLDDVNLRAWYIPSRNSNKIVVFNHFLLGNRAGAKPNPDWGNIAVDFMPIYQHLVKAGYSVFTYDLRNHGDSDVHNGGHIGLTHVEFQDVIAATRYAREKLPEEELYLYSQCYGTVATMRAMEKHPDEFSDIVAHISLQPLSADAFVTGVCRKFDLEHPENVDYFSNRLKKKTGYEVGQLKAPDVAKAVRVPTLLVQVHDDWRTTPEDLEKVYANLGTTDKKLLWIRNEEERLEGYNYFAREPNEMIMWFESHRPRVSV